jgi:pyruvate formate lyase activating enzyme
MSSDALISDIQRFCIHDGPGIRTTVFFKGCALSCIWCHNPESMRRDREIMYDESRCLHCGECLEGVERCPSGALEVVGVEMTVEEILAEVEKDRVFYDESGGGMTLSGGEPLLHAGFAYELCREARDRGIHTCIETSGFAPLEDLTRLIPQVDLFLWDIKDTRAERHEKYTGVSNEKILENLEMVDRRGARTLLRCIILNGLNADAAHIESVARLYGRLENCEGVELLAYHPLGQSKLRKMGRAGDEHMKWIPEPDLMRELADLLQN